jgi:RNA polymerase sigma factor (sigma-70 family)
LTALSPASERGLDAAQLYERYGAQLHRFCLGRLRSPEEAEDAVQNVFLRVHTALQKGVVPEFESAWLYKIAHNVCLSRIESRGRRARLETPSDLDEMEYMLAAPEHDHEPLDGLADALAELPHNLRQALLLREWHGLSQPEIADAMATTVSAVETLLYRARKQLAAALEQGGRRGRRVVAGLFNVFGLRALLSRLLGALAGAGPGPVAAGVAALALGGSGVGAAVVLGTGDGPAPAQTHGGVLPSHRIGTPAGGSAVFGGAATSRPAGVAVHLRTVQPVEPAPAAATPHTQPSAPAATHARHAPAPAQTVPAPTAPLAPETSVPTVATPTLPAVPALDQVVTTATDTAKGAVAAVTDATATVANTVTTATDAASGAVSAVTDVTATVANTATTPSAPSVPSLPLPGLGG